MWKGGFTSRVVGNHKNRYELRFEEDGTVTATEKNPFLQQSGQGTWTREGAFVMNYPEEVFTGTVTRRGGKWRIEGHFRRWVMEFGCPQWELGCHNGDDGPQWEEYAPLEAPGNPAPTGTCCCTIA